MKTFDKLAKLEKEVVDRQREYRELQQSEARLAERSEELAELVLDAEERGEIAIGGGEAQTPEVKKLIAEAGALRSQREDRAGWKKRYERARQKIAAAEAERNRFVVEHAPEIAAELAPRSVAAAERCENALQEVINANAELHGVSATFSNLLQAVPGVDGRDVPMPGIPFDRAVTEAKRALEAGVRPPFPQSFMPPEGLGDAA